MYCCSPIAGERFCKSVPNLSHSYVHFQDLLPAIGEQWYIKMSFWQFCTYHEICGQCGKLSELHWDVSLSSIRGEKVLNSIEICRTQDPRVQHISKQLLAFSSSTLFWLLGTAKYFLLSFTNCAQLALQYVSALYHSYGFLCFSWHKTPVRANTHSLTKRHVREYSHPFGNILST